MNQLNTNRNQEGQEVPSIGGEISSMMERLQRLAPHQAEAAEMRRAERRGSEVGAKLKKANYPQRHRDHLGKMYGPGLAKAQELLPRVIGGDCLIILYGERGPGKTQMATWWAAQRVAAGKSAGVYAKCADIFEEIKRTWADGGRAVGTEHDVLRRYRSTPYLVVDEVHEISGTKSDWHPRVLINILDHRYDARLTTVLIANFAEGKLEEEVNPSILSRSVETGGAVHCDWPSYRMAR